MASSTSHDTLILGVGNPLMGDDAIGVLAVERLRCRADLPPAVTVVDGGTDGLGLISVMEGYRCVIVVDAVDMGLAPGTMRRFTWQEVHINQPDGDLLSLHQTDLAGALSLADALHLLPPEVVIFGVQPHTIAWDDPLSETVERVLPDLIDALIYEVRSSDTYGEENLDH